MKFIKKMLEKRRNEKMLAYHRKKIDEMLATKGNRIARTGTIYGADDEQPLRNRLDAIFDKHHGY